MKNVLIKILNAVYGEHNKFSYVDTVMKDITDGSIHKSKMKSNSISLTLAIDGIPTAKSTKRSIIPIFGYINKLPVRLRKKFSMLIAIWEGENKPDANLHLTSLVNELNSLTKVRFLFSYGYYVH